jgi:hypothetical protein
MKQKTKKDDASLRSAWEEPTKRGMRWQQWWGRFLGCDFVSTGKVTGVLKDDSTFNFKAKHSALIGLEEGDTTIIRNTDIRQSVTSHKTPSSAYQAARTVNGS